jgi:hypothetical protein
MKRGTPNHPKTLDLAVALGLKRWGAVGLLESLWHFTVAYAPSGDIGRHSDPAIARAIDWEGDPAALIRALVAGGWLDRCRCHRIRVHDWPRHADQTCKRALANAGETFLSCYSDASSLLAESVEVDSPPLPLAVAVALPLAKPEPLAGPVAARPPADCAGFPASREADLEAPASDDLRRELVRLAGEGAASPWGGGKDGQQLIAAASMVGDRCIDNPYSPHLKRGWIETTISRLRQTRAVHEARNPAKLQAPPSSAAQWIEAHGGAEQLARECAEACGFDPEAKTAREAWFTRVGMPMEAWASIVWHYRRAIDEHRRAASA